MTTPKIACPFCGHLHSTVTDVRPAKRDGVSIRGDGVWRRRQCAHCHRRFTTSEVLIGKYPLASTSHHNI